MTSLEHPHNHEHERSKETIFPLDPDLIAYRMRIFEASSDEFLNFVIKSREGRDPTTSLYANMPTLALIEWHELERDFDQSTELHYLAGLLNGMDIAKATRLQNDPMATALRVNNPDAFSKALGYMKETYRGLEYELERGWDRQRDRELHFTGSNDILTEATAHYDRISKHINERETSTDETVKTLALYVGMVDGAIFVDAYSAFEHGKDPQIYEAT